MANVPHFPEIVEDKKSGQRRRDRERDDDVKARPVSKRNDADRRCGDQPGPASKSFREVTSSPRQVSKTCNYPQAEHRAKTAECGSETRGKFRNAEDSITQRSRANREAAGFSNQLKPPSVGVIQSPRLNISRATSA